MEKISNGETHVNNRPTTALYYIQGALILGLMGAFFWAIRGTSGYGGSQGGLLAGLGWAVLWYGLAHGDGMGHSRPYAAPRVVAAITFGIAFGGLTGYGVYIAWLQGRFYLNYPDAVRSIAPWTGYAMLFFCGLHWGGITGAFLAWCAPRRPVGRIGWVVRLLLGSAGAVLAWAVVRGFPQWFLPFYDEGVYTVIENRTCMRASGSILNIAPHVGLFLGFLVFESCRRDWRAVGMMLVLALGFAVPFTVGGYWHTLHGSSVQLDWWKHWEMSIGLGGGLAFGLAFYLFNRPVPGAEVPAISRAEVIWGGGVPLWLGGCFIFMSAYSGFINIHGLDWPVWARVMVTMFYVIPVTAVFLRWITKTPEESMIPFRPLVLTVVLIVAAGFLVSTPLPLRLGNMALLALYTFYVGASLLLVAWMRPFGKVSDH